MKVAKTMIDISWPLSPKTTSVNDIHPVKYERDQFNNYNVIMNVHTGTHVDAPLHYLKEGKAIHEIPIYTFCGGCKVLDFTNCKKSITRADLEEYDESIKKGDIILLKTKNSEFEDYDNFNKDYVYLEEEGAEYLVRKQIKAVGIDYLRIGSNDDAGKETHITLLDNGVGIIQGLRLRDVETLIKISKRPEKQQLMQVPQSLNTPSGDVSLQSMAQTILEKGCYICMCMPLNLIGASGAPARAILFYR